MGRHLRQTRSALTPARVLGPLVVVAVAAVVAGVALTARAGAPANLAQSCPTAVRVVTAASFAPVVTGVAPALAQGPDCVGLEVTVADGRNAAARVAEVGADVWIPDDAGWASNPGPTRLASDTGTVVAESPFYLVTDEATAQRVAGAGGGWLGLAGLVTGDGPVRLAVRDPGGSGDGMLGMGAFAESVWVKDGMDASAEALAAALPRTRTVPGDAPALPEAPGEVGLVPEHGLLPVRERARQAGSVVLAPLDHTAALRYSWLPTAAATADPARAAALDRLAAALTGPAADGPLAQAGLRRPGGGPPPGVEGLPAAKAPLFDVLGPHHVDHVLASWYAADRRSDLLVAVDVSGSMLARAPGSDRTVIEVVRDGIGELASLLPDDSQLTLWRFGTRLDGTRDHEAVLRGTTLDGEGRAAVSRAVGQLVPQRHGHRPARHHPGRVRGGPGRSAAGRAQPRRRLHRRAQRGRPAHAEPRGARAAAGGSEGPSAARRAHGRRVRRATRGPGAQGRARAGGRVPGRAAHGGRGESCVHPRRRGRHPRVSAAVPDFRGSGPSCWRR